MQHAFGFIWGYEIKIVQIIFCMVVFDLLSLIRRITKFEYVPIYFIFFPAGHSDKLYAEYFNEDLFYQYGSTLTIQEKGILRVRLIRMAIVSAVIASVVSPWLTGFVLANFIAENTFYDFILVVFLILSYRIFKSLGNARSESEVVRSNFPTVLFMYVMYFVFTFIGLIQSYSMSQAALSKDGLVLTVKNIVISGYNTIFCRYLWLQPSHGCLLKRSRDQRIFCRQRMMSKMTCMSKNFSGRDFSVEAMAITLTEMRFRGFFFRVAESLYIIVLFFCRKNCDSITIGLSQVRYLYWKQYYNKDIFCIILFSFSLDKSYQVAKYYISSKNYVSERELLEGYNGRPSRVYVRTFRANRRRLLNACHIRTK